MLGRLLERTEYKVIQGDTNIAINKLCYDSRKVEKGDVFVCIKGAGFNAHDFVDDVVEKGAAALIVQEDVEVSSDVTVVKVENTRKALACMSAAYFDYPAEQLTTIGITGTKGKTTTTYMVKSVLDSVGIKTGLIGTIGAVYGDEIIKTTNTTPESFVIQEVFRKWLMPECSV